MFHDDFLIVNKKYLAGKICIEIQLALNIK